MFIVAPEPVENCSVINKSSDTFHISCSAGFDGGMNQSFHILVRERLSNHVKYDNASLTKPELIIGKSKYGYWHNKQSPIIDFSFSKYCPMSIFYHFPLDNLEPGVAYIVAVIAINKKGEK